MNYYASDEDPRFFVYFAADGFFDRFGGLREAGQSAVPVLRPAFLAAQEDLVAFVIYHSHDHGWVGPRE